MTPQRLTPAAEELTTLAGVTGESFREAAKTLLTKLASIRLCEATVQRTSEAAGRRLRELLQKPKVLGGPNGAELELILDFWHAADSLLKLAKAIQPSNEEAREKLMTAWCHTLKHEGGARMVEELEKLDLPRKPTVRSQYAEMLGYFKNNVHRMDYPRYLANGWFIGSGAMESACKTVVGQRLKLSGMRWGEAGTDEMCQLRALYRSEPAQWELF